MVLLRPLAGALALVIVAAACATAPSGPAQRGSALGEQRSEAEAVTIVARWTTSGAAALDLSLDTHSVDLDGFDLAPLTRARVDGGAWLAASQWDAPKGGHHRSGTLRFAALDRERLDSARTIEVEIRDIATPVRLLRWERPT